MALACVFALAATAFAATTKIAGSVEYKLAPPAENNREGAFSGKLETRKVCRGNRAVVLTPASDNFPNTTGYVIAAKTNRSGRFSGTYKIPGKPGTYSFSLKVEKEPRTVNGMRYLCRARSAPAASVTRG